MELFIAAVPQTDTYVQNLPGYKEARAIFDKNTSARAKAIQSLEAVVDGTQYDGRQDWFSEAHNTPLWERRPCVVYPIVKVAIDSNGDLLLGEGRFPEARVAGLEGDDAEAFEKASLEVMRQARFKAACRESFAAGQGSGSACAIYGIRNRRLFIDTVFSRWCTAVLDVEGAVEALEVRYPYLIVQKSATGEEKVVCMMYRRVIDKADDITFKPAKAKEDGTEPAWVEERKVVHGLGFCPVVWYPHGKGCSVVDDIDGRAIHENLTDEIQALDFTLSQRHRAAIYCGDPQWTEIGVQPGTNPSAPGRTAEVPASRSGRPGDARMGAYTAMPYDSSPSKARKKSPGTVWQYEGKRQEVEVKLHTLPGDSFVAMDNHAKDLRAKIAEGLGVVFLDAESLPNESRLSGKALESFKARQLDRVDYYRSDFGDRFILPSLGMLLRIAIVKNLPIKGLEVVKKAVADAGEMWSWHAPPIDLVWGDYFKPGGEEEFYLMQGAAMALESGFATPKVIVEKLRSILGIQDVDSFMSELEEHTAKQQALQADQAMAEAKAKAAAAPPKPAPQGKVAR